MREVDSAPFTISMYGMILSALVSEITGLVAAYYSLKAGERWRHSILTYAALNASIILWFVFVFFTT